MQTSGQHCPRSLKNSSQDNEEPPPSNECRPCVNINSQQQSLHCCHNTGNTKERLLCCHNTGNTKERLLCCQKKLWSLPKYQKKSRGTKNLIIYRKMSPKTVSHQSKTVKSNHDILCSHQHYSGRYEDVFWDNCNTNNHGERVHLINRSPTKLTCTVDKMTVPPTLQSPSPECTQSETYASNVWPFSEEKGDSSDDADCKSCDTNRKINNNSEQLFDAIYELLLSNSNCNGNELVQGTQSLAVHHISRNLYKYLLFFKSPILLTLDARIVQLAKCTCRSIVVTINCLIGC